MMALALVSFGSFFVARIAKPAEPPIEIEKAAHDLGWSELFISYGRSLAHVSLRTIPLIVIGIWTSMWIMPRIWLGTLDLIGGARIFGIVTVALGASLLTLPSLFEIPLALSVLAAGGPTGAAAAVLFAGPATNLSSLLVIGRHSSWKVGVTLALVVWVIAATGGLLVR
jgi:uncharacterized membrane protein YraQ (UPF0718 family)